MLKHLFSIFLLGILIHNVLDGRELDYTPEQESYNYDEICEKTGGKDTHLKKMWPQPIFTQEENKSSYFVEIDGLYYIKKANEYYVLSKDGSCCSFHQPSKSGASNIWNTCRWVMEHTTTVRYQDPNIAKIEQPRIEKIGKDEYILTTKNRIALAEHGPIDYCRIIIAYIRNGNVLYSERYRCVGLSLRLNKDTDLTAEQYCKEQLQILKNLYKIYYSKEYTGHPLNSEAERRIKACQIIEEKERKWFTPLWAKNWGLAQKIRNKDFFTPAIAIQPYWGTQLSVLLKLQPLAREKSFPNINEGVATTDILKMMEKAYKYKWTIQEQDGGEISHTALLFNEEHHISVRYCIFHHYCAEEARKWLLSHSMLEANLTIKTDGTKDLTEQDIASGILINPNLIGDFDFCFHPIINNWGVVEVGSERRAIYFLRGNTGVIVAADTPNFDVLPVAKLIDEALKKKLNVNKERK